MPQPRDGGGCPQRSAGARNRPAAKDQTRSKQAQQPTRALPQEEKVGLASKHAQPPTPALPLGPMADAEADEIDEEIHEEDLLGPAESRARRRERERARVADLEKHYAYTLARAEKEGAVDDWAEIRKPKIRTFADAARRPSRRRTVPALREGRRPRRRRRGPRRGSFEGRSTPAVRRCKNRRKRSWSLRENLGDVDVPRRRVAATPRPRRGSSAETSSPRASTWIVRGDEFAAGLGVDNPEGSWSRRSTRRWASRSPIPRSRRRTRTRTPGRPRSGSPRPRSTGQITTSRNRSRRSSSPRTSSGQRG